MLSGALLLSANAFSQTQQPVSEDGFYSGFVSPPNEAKPCVWWHWMTETSPQREYKKTLNG
jgi:hypothetical protein